MWSRLAPKYFWGTLLVDALPFISCETVAAEGALLNSEQTYELMHCLQEECSWTNSTNSNFLAYSLLTTKLGFPID